MKIEAAIILVDNSDAAKPYGLYSGRGMFGQQTEAVCFESESDFFIALANMLRDCDEEQQEQVAEALVGIRKDSLGLGVIYY